MVYNSLFLLLAETAEFLSVILSIPARIMGYIASFCYGASRAYNDEEQSEDDS